MPPLYENAKNDFSVADKYRDEAAGGLRDVLQAEAQQRMGQIGIDETISRGFAGIGRIVNGSIGSVLNSNFSGSESNSDDDFLPKLEFAEKQKWQDKTMSSEDVMDSEDGTTSQTKKEKAIYLEKQKDISGDDEGMTRQIKKEKMSYLDKAI